MINPRDRPTLQRLVTSPEWKIVENIANQVIDQVKEDPKAQSTQWETIKKTLLAEGQTSGIRRLLQEIHKHANDSP